MYVYILRDKETGETSVEKSRFGLVDSETRDLMFRVSVADILAADELIKRLNIPMLTFGEPDINRVDKSVYYDVLHSRNLYVQRVKALEDSVEKQAAIIRDNNIRIELLENEVAAERTKTSDRETVLHNVMGALALDMALERTHQQRNAAMRHIVRLIKRILDNVGLDMDDIPF